MTAPPASEAQIRARIEHLIGDSRYAEERVFAIQAEPRWNGAEVLHVNGRPVRVVPCSSSLAAREALTIERPPAERLVLLIDRPEDDLGDDLRARLARHRPIPLDPWETLRGLFRAQRIDPRLGLDRTVATALIEAVPPGAFPAAPGGFLTADLAWGTLLQHRLELPRAPGLGDLLVWAEREESAARWRALSGGLRAAVGEELALRLGPTAEFTLRLLAAERGADALPLGLVLRVVASDAASAETLLVAARVRLETLLGGTAPTEATAATWTDESERLVREPLSSGDETLVRARLGRAERLLKELGVAEIAHLSDVLESGFDQRLAALAAAALTCAAGGAVEDGEASRAAVARHLLARLEPGRARAGRMAVRLARWLSQRATAADRQPDSFVAASAGYADELSYVDWARRTLWGGDADPAVRAAFDALTRQADEARRGGDLAFARLLAGWLAAGADPRELVPLEQVIERVVGPLVLQSRVLVLVADGMSVDIAHELMSELGRRGWAEIAPKDVDRPLVGVAALPTVTEVCRTSLIAGVLTPGDASREKRRFRDHAVLAKGGDTPLLWHRGDLSPEGAHRVPDEIVEAVQAGPRIVGAVVNAVDDLLLKGGQLRPAWSPESIPVLATLLDAARVGDRLVVLVSDHGHVAERSTTYRPPNGASGERWRAATTPPADDEVLLKGSRVVLGEGAVVAAATETIRYSTSRRDGYHGGATPREVLVPLRVLIPQLAAVPDGWHEIAAPVPAWWDGPAPVRPPEPARGGRRRSQAVPPEGQQPLFDPPSTPEARAARHAVAVPAWIARLLESDAYREHAARLTARQRPDQERVAAVLAALDAGGGTLTRTALARAAGVPEVRVDGVLSGLRRLLNLEGYAAISSTPDGDTVRLDVPRLLEQFGVSE